MTVHPVAPLERVICAEGLRQHWQSHRKLTRHVVEAFSEDKVFSFSASSMRPFGHLATEVVSMAAAGIRRALGIEPPP
jgi:hypothetical protein